MYERLRRELSYVQGMLEGVQSGAKTPEVKALYRLIDIIDELVESTQHLEKRFSELEEYVEEIDEDLNDVEILAYEDEEDEADGIELVCPECGEEVFIDEEDLEDESVDILCPKCHTVLLTDEDEEDIPFENERFQENERFADRS
jgi:formylmethanofuran dehydrogenase subunit E